MLSGDEFYDDDVTSGLPDDSPDPSWEEDEDGFIVEPLENRGTLDA